jgi:hypothetical protein
MKCAMMLRENARCRSAAKHNVRPSGINAAPERSALCANARLAPRAVMQRVCLQAVHALRDTHKRGKRVAGRWNMHLSRRVVRKIIGFIDL